MKAGDLVNYTGSTFQGPFFGGLILDSKTGPLRIDEPREERNVNAHRVYWASHNMTEWMLEKYLEVVV